MELSLSSLGVRANVVGFEAFAGQIGAAAFAAAIARNKQLPHLSICKKSPSCSHRVSTESARKKSLNGSSAPCYRASLKSRPGRDVLAGPRVLMLA